MPTAVDLLQDLGVPADKVTHYVADLVSAQKALAECKRHDFQPFPYGLKVCAHCKVTVANREATLYEQGLRHGAEG
jgi:hypothetical protein